MLAGDLAPYTQGLVEHIAERWSTAPHILYVLGNHEFYGTEIDETRARLAEECAEAGIHLFDPGMVRIKGVRFGERGYGRLTITRIDGKEIETQRFDRVAEDAKGNAG